MGGGSGGGKGGDDKGLWDDSEEEVEMEDDDNDDDDEENSNGRDNVVRRGVGTQDPSVVGSGVDDDNFDSDFAENVEEELADLKGQPKKRGRKKGGKNAATDVTASGTFSTNPLTLGETVVHGEMGKGKVCGFKGAWTMVKFKKGQKSVRWKDLRDEGGGS